MPLANTCYDYRNEALPNFQYRVVVFDHIDNRKYQLIASLSNGTSAVVHNWASRSALVSTPSEQPIKLRLYYRDSEEGSWIPYQYDWALYAGYIEEMGMVDVEMDFRLAPQEIAAGETLTLDKFWFGGAESGMRLILGTGTSLRPYFSLVPGYNSMLEFKDIVARDIRQIDLLSALGEMFNLAFYSDRTLKELHIEPLESLYGQQEVVDWSNCIDNLGEVSIVDSGINLPQDSIFTYINCDQATQEFNSENETSLGMWSFRNPLYGTKNSTKRVGDSLFTTTLNTSNVVTGAPSASILRVGDVGGDNDYEVAFTPRIVCYKGMSPLPEGESWRAISRLDRYPYAAFIDEESINLCFENRNGIAGLNQYYLPMLSRQRECRQITLSLYLTTAEIATLFTADGRKPSLRTTFRLNIQGESLPFRLVKIERWDSENNIVQCTFEQELNN